MATSQSKRWAFVHVGGGDQHAHAGAAGADAGDQDPRTGRAASGSDAGGGFVQDEQVGVVDERAAQGQLCFMPPESLPAAGQETGAARWCGSGRRCGGGARWRRGTGGRRTAGSLPPTAGVEVLPRPLRHVGKCAGTRGRIAVAASAMSPPSTCTCPADGAAPATSAIRLDLPTPSGADQADHAGRRHVQEMPPAPPWRRSVG